jgi:hypothetical protein
VDLVEEVTVVVDLSHKQVEQEILHQLHHHKEILVELLLPILDLDLVVVVPEEQELHPLVPLLVVLVFHFLLEDPLPSMLLAEVRVEEVVLLEQVEVVSVVMDNRIQGVFALVMQLCLLVLVAAVAVQQAEDLVVRVSSSSLILHKYSKNIKWA